MSRHPFSAVNLISDPIHGYIELTKRLTREEATDAGLPAETAAERSEKSPAFGKTVAWDGAKPIEFFKFPESVDAVIHLAQSRSYRHFPVDSREMFDVNVVMTMRLLEWAER